MCQLRSQGVRNQARSRENAALEPNINGEREIPRRSRAHFAIPVQKLLGVDELWKPCLQAQAIVPGSQCCDRGYQMTSIPFVCFTTPAMVYL